MSDTAPKVRPPQWWMRDEAVDFFGRAMMERLVQAGAPAEFVRKGLAAVRPVVTKLVDDAIGENLRKEHEAEVQAQRALPHHGFLSQHECAHDFRGKQMSDEAMKLMSADEEIESANDPFPEALREGGPWIPHRLTALLREYVSNAGRHAVASWLSQRVDALKLALPAEMLSDHKEARANDAQTIFDELEKVLRAEFIYKAQLLRRLKAADDALARERSERVVAEGAAKNLGLALKRAKRAAARSAKK